MPARVVPYRAKPTSQGSSLVNKAGERATMVEPMSPVKRTAVATLVMVALLAGFVAGAVIGGTMAVTDSNLDATASAQTQQVPGPVRIVTPPSCVTALDLATTMLGHAADALEAVLAQDVDRAAGITDQMTSIRGTYLGARDACYGAAE